VRIKIQEAVCISSPYSLGAAGALQTLFKAFKQFLCFWKLSESGQIKGDGCMLGLQSGKWKDFSISERLRVMSRVT
jgi:hypothetical protein